MNSVEHLKNKSDPFENSDAFNGLCYGTHHMGESGAIDSTLNKWDVNMVCSCNWKIGWPLIIALIYGSLFRSLKAGSLPEPTTRSSSFCARICTSGWMQRAAKAYKLEATVYNEKNPNWIKGGTRLAFILTVSLPPGNVGELTIRLPFNNDLILNLPAYATAETALAHNSSAPEEFNCSFSIRSVAIHGLAVPDAFWDDFVSAVYYCKPESTTYQALLGNIPWDI